MNLLSIFILVITSLLAVSCEDYTFTCVGSCSSDAPSRCVSGVSGGGGALLMGGGTDVDDGFKWLINQADGGDILILRASGTDAYNDYVFGLSTVHSVSTIVLNNAAAASSSFVLDQVARADAVFFAGGDQSVYYKEWFASPLQTALSQLVHNRNCSVGGTSAGLVILGGFLYTALYSTIVSPDAIYDPYDKDVTLSRDVFLSLPFLSGTFLEPHFVTRDRMGRDLVFVARSMQDGWTDVGRSIAIDEATCIAVDSEGVGTVYGDGTAYLITANKAPEVCESDQYLTFLDVDIWRVSKGAVVNVYNLTVIKEEPDTVQFTDSIDDGYQSDDFYGPNGPTPGDPALSANNDRIRARTRAHVRVPMKQRLTMRQLQEKSV